MLKILKKGIRYMQVDIKFLETKYKCNSRLIEVVESGEYSMIIFSSVSCFAMCFPVTSCSDVLGVIQTRN
jgi:hypothetical protein